jgi:hypothetical protein
MKNCGPMNLGRRTAGGGCPHEYWLGSGFLRVSWGVVVFAGFAVERGQDAVFEHTRFCFHPVLQGQVFSLSAILATLVVEMLGVQANLSFEQFSYECLLLLSSGIDIQNKSFLPM